MYIYQACTLNHTAVHGVDQISKTRIIVPLRFFFTFRAKWRNPRHRPWSVTLPWLGMRSCMAKTSSGGRDRLEQAVLRHLWTFWFWRHRDSLCLPGATGVKVSRVLPPCRRAQNEAWCDLLFDITYQSTTQDRRLGLSSSGRIGRKMDFYVTNVFLPTIGSL